MGDADRASEVEDRLIDFAVRVIKVADALPKTPAGKHIALQLLRSGTSPAPNYAEARGAESNADFVHKLKIALKELNESCAARPTARAMGFGPHARSRPARPSWSASWSGR